MKCGVVHDDEVVGVQTRAQPRLQPGIEHPGIASTVEQQGLCHASRNERRPGASMSRDQAVHTLAFGGIPIPPCRRRHTPAFIEVHGVFAAAYEPLAKTEKLLATQGVAFGIAQSFFMGHPQLAQRVPDTVAGDVELPRPFRLRAIGMGLHMTA